MVIATVPVRPRSPAPWDRTGLSPFLYRGVEQLVACRAHNPEVVGSSPSPATKHKSLKSLEIQGFSDLLFLGSARGKGKNITKYQVYIKSYQVGFFIGMRPRNIETTIFQRS